jgi:dTMP kinase
MDSDPVMSVERARRRNKAKPGGKRTEHDENRFEQESRAFFGRVRNAYLAIAEREPQRVMVIDARGTAEQTHRRIKEVVARKLKVTKTA